MKRFATDSLLVLMLLIGLATGAEAFTLGDSHTVGPSIAGFDLVDGVPGNFDNEVIMTASTLPFLGVPITGFQYSLDNSIWRAFDSTGNIFAGMATVSISPSTHTQRMYLRYGTDQSTDSMTFTSSAPTVAAIRTR